MLKAEFPEVPDEILLQRAMELYKEESQRLQSLSSSERFQEKLRQSLDSSGSIRPQKRNVKPQSSFNLFR